MSRLRLKHKMEPVVRSLGTCDYIVSNRMAVERKFLSGAIFIILPIWFESGNHLFP